MSLAVDVIVDRDDDIATIRAIHALAAREPGVLAVHIAPDTREEPAVVWAILRALGKRIEQLDRPAVRVYWMDAERWLTAHCVSEVAVLCAQHLGDSVTEELRAHLGRLRIPLTLIYGDRARTRLSATTTLGAYPAKERDPPRRDGRWQPWPQVPRSHPLRLRYDCWRQLLPRTSLASSGFSLAASGRSAGGGGRWRCRLPLRAPVRFGWSARLRIPSRRTSDAAAPSWR